MVGESSFVRRQSQLQDSVTRVETVFPVLVTDPDAVFTDIDEDDVVVPGTEFFTASIRFSYRDLDLAVPGNILR